MGYKNKIVVVFLFFIVNLTFAQAWQEVYGASNDNILGNSAGQGMGGAHSAWTNNSSGVVANPAILGPMKKAQGYFVPSIFCCGE